MVDVVLSSDNLTVLGGPSRLDVDLNIGAPGNRGSLFFVNIGNPNFLNPSQDFPDIPEIFDIYINVDTKSDDYLQAYQYVNQDGNNVWIPSFKIIQNSFSQNKVLNFENGKANINLNITNISINSTPFEDLEKSFGYINIQASLTNVDLENVTSDAKPVAFSYKVGDAFFDNAGSFDSLEFPLFVPIEFEAVEFNGTSWIPLNKKTYASLTASFANPQEIFNALVEEEAE